LAVALSRYKTVELIPGGAEVDVTKENVLDFVERAAKALLVSSTERALSMMRAGFEEVFPAGSHASAHSAEDFQASAPRLYSPMLCLTKGRRVRTRSLTVWATMTSQMIAVGNLERIP
jgi:hypothetical protein